MHPSVFQGRYAKWSMKYLTDMKSQRDLWQNRGLRNCKLTWAQVLFGVCSRNSTAVIFEETAHLTNQYRKKLNTEASFTEGLMRCGTWAEEADRSGMWTTGVQEGSAWCGSKLKGLGNPVNICQYQQLFVDHIDSYWSSTGDPNFDPFLATQCPTGSGARSWEGLFQPKEPELTPEAWGILGPKIGRFPYFQCKCFECLSIFFTVFWIWSNKDGRTQIFFTPFRPKSLDCWEYVSRRFETVNLPHVLRELDLGICFNMIIFDILSLSWKATEISSFSMSLDFFCHFSASLWSSVAVCTDFASSTQGRYFAQRRHSHGTQIRFVRLPHPCERWSFFQHEQNPRWLLALGNVQLDLRRKQSNIWLQQCFRKSSFCVPGQVDVRDNY